MCELLGISANTDPGFSFTGLSQCGGSTGPHKDGWDVTFLEGKGIRSFHDPDPSSSYKIAELVQHRPINSKTANCHIRQANIGDICLANTHPFSRELWGRHRVFADNGRLPSFVRLLVLRN